MTNELIYSSEEVTTLDDLEAFIARLRAVGASGTAEVRVNTRIRGTNKYGAVIKKLTVVDNDGS